MVLTHNIWLICHCFGFRQAAGSECLSAERQATLSQAMNLLRHSDAVATVICLVTSVCLTYYKSSKGDFSSAGSSFSFPQLAKIRNSGEYIDSLYHRLSAVLQLPS